MTLHRAVPSPYSLQLPHQTTGFCHLQLMLFTALSARSLQILRNYLRLTKIGHHQNRSHSHRVTFGNQKRLFQRLWLTQYPGLVNSEQKCGACCKFCVLVDAETQTRGQLVKEPFKNWRKAVEKLNEHFNDQGISTKPGGTGYDLQ